MSSRGRATRRSALVAIAALINACASGPDTRIDGYQYIAVDDPGGPKQVALVLASYQACPDEDAECEARLPEVRKLQATMEACIERGLTQTSPQAMLLKKADWADGANLSELMVLLTGGDAVDEDELAELAQGKGLDYLVSMGVSKSRSKRRPTSAGHQEVWGIGEQWENTAYLEMSIFEAHSGRLAGNLSARLSKDAFWMLPVVLVIPLVPIGASPNVERESCIELGEALGRFLEGAGNDYLE